MQDRVIVKRIMEDIRNGAVNPQSALSLIKAVVKYTKGDEEAVVDILDTIQKGPDGISGTSDDIPESTLEIVRFMLQHNVIRELVQELGRRVITWFPCLK